ncbi:hypothetical protein HCN44_007485 [Aphidius gifuensis]|uniref:Odorant receptor n=2 Tax=Aphidius gifuensis TaxID=684658 RepID=A0A834XLK0_APHGI|nr:hypothetical protein HCN44_007485 [Aphidius gifuensis]
MGKEEQLKNIAKCRKRLKLVTMALGIWPQKNPNTNFYCIQSYIVVVYLVIVYSAVLNFMYQNRHSFTIVLKGASLSLSFSIVTLKVVVFIYRRKKLREVEDTMEEILKSQLGKSDELVTTMLGPLDYFAQHISFGIFFFGYAIGTVLYSFPITPITHTPCTPKYTTNPTIYPYEIVGGSPLWWAHFAFESILSFVFCSIGTCTDNLFGYYCSHIMSQFRALNYEMENIKLDDQLKNNIKDIVIKHHKLINCCELLMEIYGEIVIVLLITTALILCCLVFQISQMTQITIGQVIWFTVYICYKLSQALIYAWAGEKVIEESEKFRMAIYTCSWETQYRRDLGKYLIIMMSQRPVSFTACGIVSVDAKLFTSVSEL